MKLPSYAEQNYAMNLVASALVELFPKLQILDLVVLPDRFSVDFSFSRPLEIQEMHMVKERFFAKLQRNEKGTIREMVSKNACDMLKHQKQIFLTDLVNRDEQFVDMLCMDVFHAPLIGEIDQKESKIKEVKLSVYDHGEKKWSKKKVHHYCLEGFCFYSSMDRKKQEETDQVDHVTIGKEEKLFWINEEGVFFSKLGEEKIEKLIDQAKGFFGGKVFFEGDEEVFSEVSGEKDFFRLDLIESDDLSELYGLKGAIVQRAIICFSFSNKDLNKQLEKFCDHLNLKSEMNEFDEFIVIDFKGIPWVIAEFEDVNDYLILEINLTRIFALSLEKTMKIIS
ncbi:MAG: hypothetical protein S4CHLAM20_04780 [Chlamydiia bacterium]|nr:hypothetical protein [Chlamydiia bacterium]